MVEPKKQELELNLKTQATDLKSNAIVIQEQQKTDFIWNIPQKYECKKYEKIASTLNHSPDEKKILEVITDYYSSHNSYGSDPYSLPIQYPKLSALNYGFNKCPDESEVNDDIYYHIEEDSYLPAISNVPAIG